METNLSPMTRSKNDYVTTAELRAMIKQNLGFNARQVTVKERSSQQYLTVTVRDARVDVKKVREFCAKLHTWSMDNTDYCEGQSIHVELTSEVKAALAAPFVERIVAAVKTAIAGDGCALVEGERWFSISDRYAYVYDSESGNRTCYHWASDVLELKPRVIEALAFAYSQL